MALKIFIKKGDILEYLGEDRKNVRLIDRMLAKGEIVRGEGGEYITSKDLVKESMIILQIGEKEIEGRSDELERLKEQLRESNEAYENLNNDYIKIEQENKSINSTIEELIEKGIIQRGF